MNRATFFEVCTGPPDLAEAFRDGGSNCWRIAIPSRDVVPVLAVGKSCELTLDPFPIGELQVSPRQAGTNEQERRARVSTEVRLKLVDCADRRVHSSVTVGIPSIPAPPDSDWCSRVWVLGSRFPVQDGTEITFASPGAYSIGIASRTMRSAVARRRSSSCSTGTRRMTSCHQTVFFASPSPQVRGAITPNAPTRGG